MRRGGGLRGERASGRRVRSLWQSPTPRRSSRIGAPRGMALFKILIRAKPVGAFLRQAASDYRPFQDLDWGHTRRASELDWGNTRQRDRRSGTREPPTSFRTLGAAGSESGGGGTFGASGSESGGGGTRSCLPGALRRWGRDPLWAAGSLWAVGTDLFRAAGEPLGRWGGDLFRAGQSSARLSNRHACRIFGSARGPYCGSARSSAGGCRKVGGRTALAPAGAGFSPMFWGVMAA